tara:strand:+ start:563 stop:1864 length:1302 start_codon:yes stop_codon:yes gene_type:complete
MKWLWGLLLFSCSSEYGIDKHKNAPDIVVDTAVVVTDSGMTLPPLVEETADTGDEPVPLIQVSPYDHNFGDLTIGCSDSYEVVISSIGTAPLIIDEFIYINSPDLSMSYDFTLPLVLDPGEYATILFEYDEDDLFEDNGKLYIYSNAKGKSEQRVNHYGQGVIADSHIDVFSFEKVNKADILFVVDNSCSMDAEQVDLSANAQDFVDTLIGTGTDFQISIITTDSAEPVVTTITGDDHNAGKVLTEGVMVGTGGNPFEMGQEMAMRSLEPAGALGKGFVREDATLSIVVISDENDYSPLTELEYYDFFISVKKEELFFFHSVVGLGVYPGCTVEVGDRYLDQSLYTGGSSLDICGSWGTGLTTLANPVYVIPSIYPLTKPAIPSTVEVYLGGYQVSKGWYYDSTVNAVYFTDTSAINGEDLLHVTYDYSGDCD